jgi:membrane protease YdiL (CAAX protease family)
MINDYLENVQYGKNSLWNYIVAILFTLIVGTIISSMLLIGAILIGIIPLNLFNSLLSNGSSSFLNLDLGFVFTTSFISFFSYLIALAMALKYVHKRDFMTLINTTKRNKNVNWLIDDIKRFRWDKFAKGIAIYGVWLIITFIVIIMVFPNNIKGLDINLFLTMIIPGLIATFVQCGLEELIFRGYLNQALFLKIKQPLVVIIISSFLFGLIHMGNVSNPIDMIVYVLATFIAGMIFSIATLVTDGLEFSWGMHMINNTFSFLVLSETGVGLISMIPLSSSLNNLINIITPLIIGIILFLWKKEEILKVLFPKK